MTTATPTPPLRDIYPTAHVRGRRITRQDERTLGWVTLDAATAWGMGRDQIGWFVGGHPGAARAAEQLGRLDATPAGGAWVVVPLGRDLSHELFAHWPYPEHVVAPPEAGGSVWCSRKVWFAMPEELGQLLSRARQAARGVAGVIVLDPPCVVHRSRGGTGPWGHVHHNDRPQHVVNFRAAVSAVDWQPPLVLVTKRLARWVDTQSAARAFCLDVFHCICGGSFGCWSDPITPDEAG